jgi:hypothetical protein
MSITTGYILACAVITLGACGLAGFAIYLMSLEAKQRASSSVILRADTYRARQL